MAVCQRAGVASQEQGRAGLHRQTRLVGFCAVLAIALLLNSASLWRPEHAVRVEENVQVAEAQGWWAGRLDLPERRWDTALFDGKVYSHFPPLFSFMAAALVPIFGGVPHWFLVLGIALPILLAAYLLMERRTSSTEWGAVLAIALLCGTSCWPVLQLTLRTGSPYMVNQSLALLGILVFLIEYFGKRRVAVAGAGVVMAALARQFSAFYLLPLWWMTWRKTPGVERRRSVYAAGCISMIVICVPMLMNALKFGSPFDSGYMYIYNERPEDGFSRDATTYGLFSLHYVPRNLYHSFVATPRVHKVQIGEETAYYVRANTHGTGILWTTPLLLLGLVEARRLWAEPENRVLLLACAAVLLGLLAYHSTGAVQRGFNRYSLDFIVPIVVMIAPLCRIGWRKWAAVGCTAWSLLYFGVLLPKPPIRIW